MDSFLSNSSSEPMILNVESVRDAVRKLRAMDMEGIGYQVRVMGLFAVSVMEPKQGIIVQHTTA